MLYEIGGVGGSLPQRWRLLVAYLGNEFVGGPTPPSDMIEIMARISPACAATSGLNNYFKDVAGLLNVFYQPK